MGAMQLLRPAEDMGLEASSVHQHLLPSFKCSLKAAVAGLAVRNHVHCSRFPSSFQMLLGLIKAADANCQQGFCLETHKAWHVIAPIQCPRPCHVAVQLGNL